MTSAKIILKRLTDMLEKDLIEAKEDNKAADDRRDWYQCDKAWIKINYIEKLLKIVKD